MDYHRLKRTRTKKITEQTSSKDQGCVHGSQPLSSASKTTIPKLFQVMKTQLLIGSFHNEKEELNTTDRMDKLDGVKHIYIEGVERREVHAFGVAVDLAYQQCQHLEVQQL